MRSLKPLTALALTAAGSALVVGFQVPDTGAAAVTEAFVTTDETTATVPQPTTSSGSSGSSSESAGSPSGSTDANDATTAVTSAYADGTYLGAAVDEPWGIFQVQATISGGRLVAVTIIDAPTDRHSSRINNSSLPTLTSQAVSSQSADVDVISGATWTSRSYATSLQAALDDAAAALDDAA